MRLFTAIPLSDESRRHLVTVQGFLQRNWIDAPGMDSFKWTAKNNLHITLKFLGEVSDDSLDRLMQLLSTIKVPHMNLVADALDRFPERGPISVLTARIIDLHGQIGSLFQAIESHCEELGVARERRDYIPHVTLARSRRGPMFIGSAMGDVDLSKYWPGPNWIAASFDLMQSTLTSDGAIYRLVKKIGE